MIFLLCFLVFMLATFAFLASENEGRWAVDVVRGHDDVFHECDIGLYFFAGIRCGR